MVWTQAKAVAVLAAVDASAQGFFASLSQQVAACDAVGGRNNFYQAGCYTGSSVPVTNLFEIKNYVPGNTASFQSSYPEFWGTVDAPTKFNATVVPLTCGQACQGYGFKNSLLLNNRCYCSPLLPAAASKTYTSSGDSAVCDVRCTGDFSQFCGGASASNGVTVAVDPSFPSDSAIRANAAALATGYQYLGCFNLGSVGFRSNVVATSLTSQSACQSRCAGLGYPLSAFSTDIGCDCGVSFGLGSYQINTPLGSCGTGNSGVAVYANPDLMGCYTPPIPGYGTLDGSGNLVAYSCAPAASLTGARAVQPQTVTSPGNTTVNAVLPLHPRQVGSFYIRGCSTTAVDVIFAGSSYSDKGGASSLEQCANLCSTFDYFGLQNGGVKCACTNALASEPDVDMASCSRKCASTPGESCGSGVGPIVYGKSTDGNPLYSSISTTLTLSARSTYSCVAASASTSSISTGATAATTSAAASSSASAAGSSGSPSAPSSATSVGSSGSPSAPSSASAAGSSGSPSAPSSATSVGSSGSPSAPSSATAAGSSGSPSAPSSAAPATAGSSGSPSSPSSAAPATAGSSGRPSSPSSAPTAGSSGSPSSASSAATAGSSGSPSSPSSAAPVPAGSSSRPSSVSSAVPAGSSGTPVMSVLPSTSANAQSSTSIRGAQSQSQSCSSCLYTASTSTSSVLRPATSSATSANSGRPSTSSAAGNGGSPPTSSAAGNGGSPPTSSAAGNGGSPPTSSAAGNGGSPPTSSAAGDGQAPTSAPAGGDGGSPSSGSGGSNPSVTVQPSSAASPATTSTAETPTSVTLAYAEPTDYAVAASVPVGQAIRSEITVNGEVVEVVVQNNGCYDLVDGATPFLDPQEEITGDGDTLVCAVDCFSRGYALNGAQDDTCFCGNEQAPLGPDRYEQIACPSAGNKRSVAKMGVVVGRTVVERAAGYLQVFQVVDASTVVVVGNTTDVPTSSAFSSSTAIESLSSMAPGSSTSVNAVDTASTAPGGMSTSSAQSGEPASTSTPAGGFASSSTASSGSQFSSAPESGSQTASTTGGGSGSSSVSGNGGTIITTSSTQYLTVTTGSPVSSQTGDLGGGPGSNTSSTTASGTFPSGSVIPSAGAFVVGIAPAMESDVPVTKARRQSSGFVGNAGVNNPSDCSQATQFRIINGELFSGGQQVSTNPGVVSARLAVSPVAGSITRTWEIVDDELIWANAAFAGGQAGFCQDLAGRVFFTTTGVGNEPVGCTAVDLTVLSVTDCPGLDSNDSLLPPEATLILPTGVYFPELAPTNQACVVTTEFWTVGQFTVVPSPTTRPGL